MAGADGMFIGNERLDGRAVAEVLKRAARATGLDAREIGGHSLRAGLATEAVRADVSERHEVVAIQG